VTVLRMEHIGIVVDDLAAATAFFTALGLGARRPSRAAWWTA
jgi:catechol 2,3-dioxygenase-like lactoylglutathione lyase family enzyme